MEQNCLENLDRATVLKVGKVKNKTLLDIGIGDLAVIAARDFNCNVTCIDILVEALEEAKEKAKEKAKQEGLAKKIRFEKEDTTNLSYEVSREKIIIAEFNEFGFPHSEDEYRRVNLDWVEKKLKSLGKIDKYCYKNMNFYICFKQT